MLQHIDYPERVVKDIDSPFHLDEKRELLYNSYNSYNERR